jgi:hypothetical protein
MSILTYIRNLLPSFKKDRVIEDARIIRTELETVSIPSYKEAEKIFTKWDFKSKEMQDFTKIFSRNIKTSSAFGNKDNLVVAIRKGLEALLVSHDLVEDKLQKYLEEDVVAEGITCLKANLIQCLEGISFVSKYSYKFLNYIYVVETAVKTEANAEEYIQSNFSKAEIDYIEKSFVPFCIAFGALTKTKIEFEKTIDKIPDIIINASNSDAVASTIDNEKLSPFMTTGFISDSVLINPIYHFALMVAEYQANQYKVSKETKKVLELRLLNLELINQRNPDAKLQKEIEYIQSRIQGLDYKIKKMEESVK